MIITKSHDCSKLKVLILSPFPYINKGNYNSHIDAVVSRQAGGKSKSGFYFPVGNAYITSVLEQKGFDVSLMDVVPQGNSIQEVISQTEMSDIIVMPISITRLSDTKKFLLDFKNKLRIGMSNFASIFANRILNENICDIIVHGEVEITVREIVTAFQDNPKPDLSLVKGISFLNEEGLVIRTPERPLVDDLDSIPFPQRTGFNQMVYSDVSFFGKPTAFILSSRGCPYKCVFCSTHLTYRHRVYFRSAVNVVSEIEEVVHKYKISNFFFIDDTFTLKPKRVEEICKLISEKGLKIQFICHGRIDLVNEDMLAMMKKAGCVGIRFGIESGNDDILQRIKKDLTVAQIRSGVELVKKQGIRYSLFFMLGNPDETLETIEQTISLAKELDPFFASFNIATPLPGSELFEQNREHYDYDNLQKFDAVNSVISVCEVPIKVLRRKYLFAYFRFYFRWGFMKKLLLEFYHEPKFVLKFILFLFRHVKVIFKN